MVEESAEGDVLEQELQEKLGDPGWTVYEAYARRTAGTPAPGDEEGIAKFKRFFVLIEKNDECFEAKYVKVARAILRNEY